MSDRVVELVELLRGRRVVALTGAGCSTDSGIPDYRSPGQPVRPRRPVQHLDFMRSPAVRRRYWARSTLGWPRIRDAHPNQAHAALAALEQAGVLVGVITQNVDGLHHAAGSRRVIELHGALARVRCMTCSHVSSRAHMQTRLLEQNGGFRTDVAVAAPDGDADLSDEQIDGFVLVECDPCGGVLKPDVVFFGDNVARPIVDGAFAMLHESELLLVVGTSLTVFSGFRFVLRAVERGVPVAIVNRGPTRGDDRACLLVDAGAGEVLAALVDALGAGAPGAGIVRDR